MKRVSRLELLRVVSPCPVAWSSMEGDDQVRFCGKCRKNVYNVAAMTHDEALAVIERAEGRVCMQLTRRRDGTIATGDCWAALRRARKRGLLALAAALPVIVIGQLWSQAFGLRALYGFFDRSAPCAVAPPRMAGEIQMIPEAGGIQMIPELPPVEPERVTRGLVKMGKRSVTQREITLGKMAKD